MTVTLIFGYSPPRLLKNFLAWKLPREVGHVPRSRILGEFLTRLRSCLRITGRRCPTREHRRMAAKPQRGTWHSLSRMDRTPRRACRCCTVRMLLDEALRNTRYVDCQGPRPDVLLKWSATELCQRVPVGPPMTRALSTNDLWARKQCCHGSYPLDAVVVFWTLIEPKELGHCDCDQPTC